MRVFGLFLAVGRLLFSEVDQGGGLSATELPSATCHLDGGAGGLSYWMVFHGVLLR